MDALPGVPEVGNPTSLIDGSEDTTEGSPINRLTTEVARSGEEQTTAPTPIEGAFTPLHIPASISRRRMEIMRLCDTKPLEDQMRRISILWELKHIRWTVTQLPDFMEASPPCFMEQIEHEMRNKDGEVFSAVCGPGDGWDIDRLRRQILLYIHGFNVQACAPLCSVPEETDSDQSNATTCSESDNFFMPDAGATERIFTLTSRELGKMLAQAVAPQDLDSLAFNSRMNEAWEYSNADRVISSAIEDPTKFYKKLLEEENGVDKLEMYGNARYLEILDRLIAAFEFYEKSPKKTSSLMTDPIVAWSSDIRSLWTLEEAWETSKRTEAFYPETSKLEEQKDPKEEGNAVTSKVRHASRRNTL